LHLVGLLSSFIAIHEQYGAMTGDVRILFQADFLKGSNDYDNSEKGSNDYDNPETGESAPDHSSSRALYGYDSHIFLSSSVQYNHITACRETDSCNFYQSLLINFHCHVFRSFCPKTKYFKVIVKENKRKIKTENKTTSSKQEDDKVNQTLIHTPSPPHQQYHVSRS